MRALISVDDKTGVAELARELNALGVELISTGRTAQVIAEAGVPVQTVADVTGFPEILGGRVKTLHPAIHGGILARRDDEAHARELAAHGIAPIDLVVCNLYPFGQTVARPDVTLAEAIEQIDIGGVALLRAAAKNFQFVAVVTRPQDYELVLSDLRALGVVSEENRRRLALLAFEQTAAYDAAIAAYLRATDPMEPDDPRERLFPEELTLGLRRIQPLRYGENPHQSAALYRWDAAGSGQATLAGARLLHGKELSYNNLLDLDAALNTVASFTAPTAVVIKHTNPCGLACAEPLVEAYRRAHAGDPVSAYGGVLGFNRPVDEATAAELTQLFYEAIIAPGYTPEALALLQKKKNLRLLATEAPIGPAAPAAIGAQARLDARSVSGGLLLQTADVVTAHDVHLDVVTAREPTLDEVTSLLFAWKAVQHVKSNAIALAKGLTLIGVGAGQMNRVYSVRIAADRAGDRARGSVLASDAYFPFADGVEEAAQAGVTAIIQPGGSIRDAEVIAAANAHGVAMVTTGVRHFRH